MNIDLKSWNKDTADNFTSEDQTLFVISKLIDKCAIMIMQCGFSINDLSKKEGNPYLKIISDLVSKLSFYISTILTLNPSPLLDNFMINAGSLLRYLSNFQYSEPLVFYQCLDTYIQMCLSIVIK